MSIVEYQGTPYFLEGKEGSKSGVIVIQEWWGLNGHIKNMTRRLAEKLDALAISPDLYRGRVATKPDEASHLMKGLDWPGAIEDIRKGIQFLKSKGAEKVAIVGFCMGGALVIASGAKVPELAAGSCFYGIPPAAFADPKDIQIPMQFHFGDKDHAKGFSDKESADKLKATLADAGKDVSEFFQYDADHAFMNEEAPAYPFNEEVAKVAFENTVRFFKKYLH